MRYISILLIFGSFQLNAQWTQTYNQSVTNDFVQSLDFTQDGFVIAVRQNDFITSLNNGNSWTTNSLASIGCAGSWSLYNAAFLNKDTGYIMANTNTGSYFAKAFTTNTMTSFTCASYNADGNAGVPIDHPSILPSGKCFATNTSGKTFKSIDFGNTWSLDTQINNVRRIQFINDTVGFYITTTTIYKYQAVTDNFIVVGPSPSTYETPIVLSAFFIDANHGYIICRDGSSTKTNMLKTSDGGISWQELFQTSMMTENYLNDLFFLNKDTGFVVGNELVLRTLDGGNSWEVQRFNGVNFSKVCFKNFNEGVMGGVKSSSTRLFTTSNCGGNWVPFNYFYFGFGTSYCCASQSCPFLNAGSASFSYTWMIDGVPMASTFNSSNMITTGGNHLVSLISDYGTQKDTFNQMVYFAPPLPAGTTINTATPDTFVCYNTDFSVYVYTVAGYTYRLYSGGNPIGIPITGSGAGMFIYSTSPITSNQVIELRAETQYSQCPGNSVSKFWNIQVSNYVASAPLSLSSDTICNGDTITAYVPVLPVGWSCKFTKMYPLGGSLSTNFTSTGMVTPFLVPEVYGTIYLQYQIEDTNYCTTYSPKSRLFVDSLHARITGKTFGFIGDTIRVNQTSEGAHRMWHYPSSFLQVVDTLNADHGLFKITNSGSAPIWYTVYSDFGCRDSAFQIINTYEVAPAYSGSACISFPTYDSINAMHSFCTAQHMDKRHMSVDRDGNIFITQIEEHSGGLPSYDKSTLTKFSPSGNMEWRHYANSVGLFGVSFLGYTDDDSLGNIYVSGQRGNLPFDFANLVIPDYEDNYYVAKFDSTGTGKWLLRFNSQSSGLSRVSKIKVINDNNILVWVQSAKEIVRYPGDTIIWANNLNVSGFFLLDSLGNVKYIYELLNDPYYNQEQCTDECLCNNQYLAGMDFEIIGSKIVVCSVLKHPAGTFNGGSFSYSYADGNIIGSYIGILTVMDTSISVPTHSHQLFHYYQNNSLQDESMIFAPISPGNTSQSSEDYLEVNNLGEIFLMFSPGDLYGYSQVDTFTRTELTYYIPGTGHVLESSQSTIFQKVDTNGNIAFSRFLRQMHVYDMKYRGNGELVAAGRYQYFTNLPSTNGNHYSTAHVDTTSGIIFCYDRMGNLQWAENVESESFTSFVGLGISDTCNANIYACLYSPDTSVFHGQTYAGTLPYYMVQWNLDNNCNDSGYCPNISWAIPDTTTAGNTIYEKQPLENLVHVYPNPFNSVVEVVLPNAEVEFVYAANTLGEKIQVQVSQTAANRYALNFENEPTGWYILHFTHNAVPLQVKVCKF